MRNPMSQNRRSLLKWLVGGAVAAAVGSVAAASQDEVAGSLTDAASRDLRGEAADKPDATTVPVNSTYWSLDTGDFEYSDGTRWKEVAV
jgi:hypothetical protein